LSMMKDIDLVFVYDTDFKKSKALAKQYSITASENLESSLKQVDAVIIATPTTTHFEYIKLVSHYVKNIFVEKPLTENVKTSRQVHKLIQSKGLNVQVGFIERFNPAVIALKSVLQNKNVININFKRTNKMSSRIVDVDVIVDLMIHDLDLACYLNGPVNKVSAYGVEKENLIVFANVTLCHDSGAFSNITASRITEKRMRHISVTCEDLYIDCNLLSKEVFINKQTVEKYNKDMDIISLQETIDVRPQEALLSELIAFTRLIESGNKENIPTESVALNAIELIDQIYNKIEIRKLS